MSISGQCIVTWLRSLHAAYLALQSRTCQVQLVALLRVSHHVPFAATFEAQGLSAVLHHRISSVVYMPRKISKDGIRIRFVEPAVPCTQLLQLSHLTSLHMDRVQPGLTAMSGLQALHIQTFPDDGLPDHFSALQRLTKLNVGIGRLSDPQTLHH